MCLPFFSTAGKITVSWYPMKPIHLPALFRRAILLASLTTLGSSAALADTWYWDSDPVASGAQQTSGTWVDGGSTWWNGVATVPWNNAAVPGNIAHFGTSGGVGILTADDVSRTITVSDTVNAAGLVFNTSASGFGYILSGGTIGLADNSTIDILGVTLTDTNRRHQILSSISGANIGITRSAATGANLSMLQLRGINNWTGNLALSSTSSKGLFVEAYIGSALNTLSSVSIGTDSILVLATADAITPNFSITGTGPENRGAIRFDVTGGSITGSVTLTGNAAIGALASGTVSGNIGESGGARTLSINVGNNTGTVTLSGANTHTGGTILNAGTLGIHSATALGTGNFTITAGTINNSSTGSITLTNNNAQTWNGNFAFSGTQSLNLGTGAVSLGTAAGTARTVTVNNNTLTVGGVISDGATANGLTKAGGGTLTLSGPAANVYTGLTTVNGGILSLGKAAGVNAIAGNVLISGGFLRFAASAHNQIADTAAITVTGGGFNTSDTGVVNGGLTNLIETVGSLAVSGGGVFSLNGPTSNFTVNAGASFTGGTGAGAIFFMGSGGSFSANSLTVANMSRTSSTAVDNAGNRNGFAVYGNNTTQSAVKIGAGGLTLTGDTSANNILLRGGNTTGVNGSRLSLDGDVTTTGTFASSIIRDSAGGTIGATLVALSDTVPGAVTRTFNVGGGGADLTIGAGVAITNGASSSAGLTKTGEGTLTLNGTNTYTGATTVNGGKLQLGGGINSSTQISVTGATLELLNSDIIGNNASLTLNNSLLIAGGANESLGTLTITGNNMLDLVSVGNAIFFADSSSTTWSSTLAILNWNALAFGETGENQLFFGTDAGGLDETTQLSKISFINPTIDGVVQTGTYGAAMLASGEVVAVIPEPSSLLLTFLGFSAVLGRRLRK